MFFTIDASNGVPIFEQVVRQVQFAIAEEVLRPGQLLPSARTLSVELAINPNTVVRAFQQLQAEGILESLRGRGLAVCAGATKRCQAARRSLVAERLRSVLTEALHGGLSVDEINAVVHEQLTDLDGKVTLVSSSAGFGGADIGGQS